MSTISNERLEEMRDYDTCVRLDESAAMAAELLVLRKEREKAEPVAYIFKHPVGKLFWALTDESNKDHADVMPVYAAPPAPSHENVHYADAAEAEIAALRKRIAELEASPPAPVVADAATAIRACLDEFPESVHDIVEECAVIAENACRAAMIQSAMQPCDKCGLTGIHACMGSTETDTTSQQFESLAGMAVVTDEKGNLPCPFCGGRCDPNGWMGSYDDGVPMCGPECEDCGATASSIEEWNRRSTALAGKAVVPEGWKLVPLEPTKEMVAKMRYHNGGYDKHIKNGYAAMLSVAPEPCK